MLQVIGIHSCTIAYLYIVSILFDIYDLIINVIFNVFQVLDVYDACLMTILRVGEWLLYNTKWASFQEYHDEKNEQVFRNITTRTIYIQWHDYKDDLYVLNQLA